MTANERFEVIGDLYYGRYFRLRPGKSEAPETGRDSNDEENRQQFDNWIATKAFTDAIEWIAEQEKTIKLQRAALEVWKEGRPALEGLREA